MLKKKNNTSVDSLVAEVNGTIGLFDKIVNNLKSAKEKIDVEVLQRTEEIKKLEAENKVLTDLGTKAMSVSEKIQALLS